MSRKPPPDEIDFRIRPRRPRVMHDDQKAWSGSFKKLIRLVRMTTKPTRASHAGIGGGASRRRHLQRCAIRVTYSPNRVRGQWAAHGRYIARGSATKESAAREAGFSTDADGIDIAKTLNDWQSSGDQRLFKMIVSPEFGERLDLKRHTRDLFVEWIRIWD